MSMTEDQNALVVFAEECGEVAIELLLLQKQLMKAIRFGIDEQRDLPTSNRERIESEWNDLLGTIKVLEKRGIDLKPNIAQIVAKVDKVEKYTAYSKSLGQVETNQAKCDCCDRADEYNGFGSGHTIFTCPKHCSCHD